MIHAGPDIDRIPRLRDIGGGLDGRKGLANRARFAVASIGRDIPRREEEPVFQAFNVAARGGIDIVLPRCDGNLSFPKPRPKNELSGSFHVRVSRLRGLIYLRGLSGEV